MYNDKPVLDVHAHLSAPPGAGIYLPNMLGSNTALPNPLSQSDGIMKNFGVTLEDFREAAAAHVQYIDDRAIDAQIVGPRPYIMLGWIEPHIIEPWTRYVNDLIEQQVSFFPDRFLGACALPLQASADSTAHCLGELERCVNEKGFVAAYLSPDPDGRRTAPSLNDSYWFDLYEACEALGTLLIIHCTNFLDSRVRHVPHNYQLGFLTEQYIAVQCLSHSDVFDRFPNLRMVSCHCGGALDRFIPTDPHLSQRDLSGNLYYDTCIYDEHLLEAGIKQRTPQRLCFGVEAPGSGQWVRPESGRTSDDLVPIISGFPWLSEEEKDLIFYENAARLCPQLAEVGWRGVASSQQRPLLAADAT